MFYGWWIVVACLLVSLYVDSVVFFGFTAFFEPLVREFGWSHTQVSSAASLRGLTMGLLAPLVGFLVDRFGSRRLIFCGVIVVGSALIVLSRTRTLAMFYVFFLCLSLGAVGCGSIVTMSAVVNWFEKKVGKALGVMTSGFGASGLMVPLMVWLIDVFNWRIAFAILGFGMWMLGIPLSLVIRERSHQCRFPHDEKLTDNSTPQDGMEQKKTEMNLKEVLKHTSFLYLNIAEAIRMIVVSGVVIHVMPYLATMSIPRPTAGLVAAAIPVISITGRFGFGWLSDFYDKRRVMAVVFCLMGMGMPVFCYVGARWAVYVFLLLFSTSFGAGWVLSGAILRDYYGTESYGKMLGIVFSSGSIGGIIGPVLVGWVFDSLGNYHFVWLGFSFLIGLAITLIVRIKPEKSAWK